MRQPILRQNLLLACIAPLEKDMVKAGEYFNQLCHAMDIYGFSKPLYLACKQAVYERVIGHNGTERLPALSLADDTKKAIADKLKELGL